VTRAPNNRNDFTVFDGADNVTEGKQLSACLGEVM
jgi:hypothetical protein